MISIVTSSTVLISLTGLASAQNQTIGIFPIDSKPYNMSYPEWSAKWWIWALSIPAEENPVV